MNCFSCHGGSVYGRTLPGAPNNLYQLQSLTEDSRATKLRMGKPLAQMDIGSAFMPLGTTVGTTNAVMFGVALMNFRDAELNVQSLGPHRKWSITIWIRLPGGCFIARRVCMPMALHRKALAG